MKVKSLSRVRLLATPWTATHQAPPSMGFSRQEYWSGLPLPSPKVSLGAQLTGSFLLSTSKQCQLHRCCFYTCFWTSWACNKDIEPAYSIQVPCSEVHKSTTTCRECRHMTMYARHVNLQHAFTSLEVHSLEVSINT